MLSFVFLISCFYADNMEQCYSTPVANTEVCHALIRATNKLGEENNAGGVSYYPNHRCVQINQPAPKRPASR